MIVAFKNQATEDVFNGKNTKAARKLDQLDSVNILDELKVSPGNRLEALIGDRESQFSIRINDQYRVCFTWSAGAPDEVEIIDYH